MDNEPNTTSQDEPVSFTLPPPPPPQAAVQLPSPIWLILVLVAFALGLGAGYGIWARPQQARAIAAEQKLVAAEATAAADKAAAQPAAGQDVVPEDVKRYDVPVGGNAVLGKTDAKITIIEFSDYQCPFCIQWDQEVLPKILAAYGDKVSLVYRDFPLEQIHPEAFPAAEAANCAGEQKKYYPFHDLLFTGGKELGRTTYEAYAAQLGLNANTFKQCLDDRKYQSEVQGDLDFAANLGVRSTPTFFVNGLAIVGAQPFEVFQQVIDLELAGKIPQ